MKIKTYYLLYKITNLLNGMIYVGVHKTQNKDDSYMGSGKLIQRAIKKYGIKNFKKTILKECSSQKELYLEESKLVNESFVKRKDTYNLVEGGLGGNGLNFKGKVVVKDKNGKIFQVSVNNKKYLSGELISLSKGHITVKDKNGKIFRTLTNNSEIGKTLFATMTGKKHSEETKAKMRLAKKASGSKNGSYGTMWITNGKDNKKIKKEELIPNGFKKGMVRSEETKNKIKLKMKLVSKKGIKSPRFGMMWITNGKENKSINKYSKIPKGFRKGRIMKFK